MGPLMLRRAKSKLGQNASVAKQFWTSLDFCNTVISNVTFAKELHSLIITMRFTAQDTKKLQQVTGTQAFLGLVNCTSTGQPHKIVAPQQRLATSLTFAVRHGMAVHQVLRTSDAHRPSIFPLFSLKMPPVAMLVPFMWEWRYVWWYWKTNISAVLPRCSENVPLQTFLKTFLSGVGSWAIHTRQWLFVLCSGTTLVALPLSLPWAVQQLMLHA